MMTKDQMINMMEKNTANLKNAKTKGSFNILNGLAVQMEVGFKKMADTIIKTSYWQHEDWIGTERARLYVNDEAGNKMFYIEATKEGDYVFVK